MNFSTSVDVEQKIIFIFIWEWSKYVLGFCYFRYITRYLCTLLCVLVND
jgi:hypothetical protein